MQQWSPDQAGQPCPAWLRSRRIERGQGKLVSSARDCPRASDRSDRHVRIGTDFQADRPPHDVSSRSSRRRLRRDESRGRLLRASGTHSTKGKCSKTARCHLSPLDASENSSTTLPSVSSNLKKLKGPSCTIPSVSRPSGKSVWTRRSASSRLETLM